MKHIIRLIIFVSAVSIFSCEDTEWYTNCSDCTSNEPSMANLTIKLSSTDLPITIRIFEGELKDSVLYNITTGFRLTELNKLVTLNKKYTVTAEYRINENIYSAIDSCTPRVKYTKDQCDEPCYFVYDRILDLRLKYKAEK